MELLSLLLLWVNIAPPVQPPVTLDDLRLFPTRDVAVLATRAAWNNHIDTRCPARVFLSVSERDEWLGWERDAYNRWYCWDDLAIATNEVNALEYRLLALHRLREWIGPAAYYAGSLPPPVPFWRTTQR